MMFSSTTCLFVICFLSLSLSATAETLRGVQRELNGNPSSVSLGSSVSTFAILTKAGISTVPTSAIIGNIGVSPIAATAITGFALTADSTNKFSTSTQVTGQVFAANYAAPTPALLTSAVSEMEAAYLDAESRLNPVSEDLGAGTLGGVNPGGTSGALTKGVHKFGSTVTIAGNLNFSGGADDVFIIQISGDLEQVANTNVILHGGAQAKNIFWQVAGTVFVKPGAHMEGIILGKTAVTFETGSSLVGRIMAQTFCALQKATITAP
jgi:hypothetical protein